LRKVKHRGLASVGADFLLNLIGYNLVSIPRLLAPEGDEPKLPIPIMIVIGKTSPRLTKKQQRIFNLQSFSADC
jgi:hypothetical protein